jgi:hypothetical protein
MSESTETAAAPSEGDSISEILEHLPPEVAQALGKSKESAPAPKAEDSEEVETDEEETEESADEESEDAADEEADDEPADEESEEEESSKPKAIDKLEKRIDKLTRRRKEAETAAEQLRAENESLKAEVEKRSAIKLEPTAEDPLADIDSADDLNAKVSAAKKVRAWALANPDGATITGPDGTERYVDRAEMAKYIAQTDALLTDHAPTRREYLREREAILPEAKAAYPDLFKPGTQAHKVMVDTLKRVPALKRLPNYEMIVGDALAGMSARMAAATKSDAAGTPKKSTPAPGAKKIAPAIPKATASRPPSTSGKAKGASLDRVIAGGGIDDLANYFAAA